MIWAGSKSPETIKKMKFTDWLENVRIKYCEHLGRSCYTFFARKTGHENSRNIPRQTSRFVYLKGKRFVCVSRIYIYIFAAPGNDEE